jgi:predicted nucleotidyltransferase
MLPTHILIQILQQHKAYLQERFGVERLVLFGSYANNKQQEDSDVDILYSVSPGKSIYI